MSDPSAPDDPIPVVRPSEQLPITYFGGVVLAVRHPEGAIYLSIRDLCIVVGLNRATQMRRLRNHADFSQGMLLFRVQTLGGPQAQDFLALDKVPAWLLGVNSARTSEEVRSRLAYLQSYLIREVYAAFARLAGLPEQASSQIEDLEELRRLETTLVALDERQSRIEQSQERARDAWRDLSREVRALVERLATLEQQNTGAISKAQRGYLYQLVQAWGAAKADQEPRLSRTAAYASVWGALKARYKLARYEDLPASRYDECVHFVHASYRTLTGSDLALPEQGELDLD